MVKSAKPLRPHHIARNIRDESYLHTAQSMPQFLVPWKVSAHRHAAIALYRALLSQCSRSGLAPSQQQQLANVVRNRFKENRYNHSKKQIPVLFKAGYSAIDHLDAAVAGEEASRTYLIELLAKAPAKAKRPPFRKLEAKAPNPTSPTPKRSILDRPLPLSELTGRRHIPRMVSAGGLPMLRIKKPQPHALGAYFRHRILKKTKRLDKLDQLKGDLQLSEQEDAWDDLVEAHGRSRVLNKPEYEPSWRDAMAANCENMELTIAQEQGRDTEMAQKMQHVVDEERKLAKEERAERLRKRDAAVHSATTGVS